MRLSSILLNLIITTASCLSTGQVFAEPASAASAGSSSMMSGLMFGGLALVFYFLIFRPQSKRAKEHRTLIEGLQKGDEVVTAGGLLGKISRIEDNFCAITVAPGTEILLQKQAISGCLPKDTLKNL